MQPATTTRSISPRFLSSPARGWVDRLLLGPSMKVQVLTRRPPPPVRGDGVPRSLEVPEHDLGVHEVLGTAEDPDGRSAADHGQGRRIWSLGHQIRIVSRRCGRPQIQARSARCPCRSRRAGTCRTGGGRGTTRTPRRGRLCSSMRASSSVEVVDALAAADDLAVALGRDHVDAERELAGRRGRAACRTP